MTARRLARVASATRRPQAWRPALGALALLLLGLALRPAALAGQRPPPDLRWRTLSTPHFRVHFHPGLDSVAGAAAAYAEEAYAGLTAGFVERPRGLVDLVVTDHVDYANGYATPFPTNRVVVFAHPPVDERSLAFFDDWMRLVITHELLHIFHLDQTSGIWDRVRQLFGRTPISFPQGFVNPSWVVEGLATHWESRLTSAGRVRGTYFEMVLRTQVLENRFFPIDRASGDPTRWPGGSTRYIYGALFLEYLSNRFGPERLNRFVREAGRWRYVNRAARRAFGTSFNDLWREWHATLRGRYGAMADSLRAQGLTEPELLTRRGYFAQFPRHAPTGGALVYAGSTGRERAHTYLIRPGAGVRGLAKRNDVGTTSWLPDGALLYAQPERTDAYRSFSDLYRVGPDGEERRLSRTLRVTDPDAHPDGRLAVAVRNAGASNELALVDLATGTARTLVPASPDVHWAYPRWSPQGDRIAVGRWRRGGYLDVVVLDSTGRLQRELTDDRAVDESPAWSPDGRLVVWSSDRTGIPNLFAYDLERGRSWQVTSVLTGAFQPDVSPDGHWVAFTYHRADGFHIARLRWDSTQWRPAPPVPERLTRAARAARAASAAVPEPPGVPAPARPYNPLPSLRPATWSPVVERNAQLGLGLGAAVGGTDVIGRHAYGAYGMVHQAEARAEGAVRYQFSGLVNPVLGLRLGQDWGASRRQVTGNGTTERVGIFSRERTAAATLLWTRPRYRSYSYLELGGEVMVPHREFEDPAQAERLRVRLLERSAELAGRVAAGYSTLGRYPFSISPEDGYSVSGSTELRRRSVVAADTFGDQYLRLVGGTRAFFPSDRGAFARHVLGTRAVAAATAGELAPRFEVGGAGGAPPPLAALNEVVGAAGGLPVRGYAPGAQGGNRALAASAEARFPLALVERGFRLLPLNLDRLWGDLFIDVGTAWCSETGRSAQLVACEGPSETGPTPIASIGAEIGVDLVFLYRANFPLRAGIAFPLRSYQPLQGAEAARAGSPAVYLRYGQSF